MGNVDGGFTTVSGKQKDRLADNKPHVIHRSDKYDVPLGSNHACNIIIVLSSDDAAFDDTTYKWKT